MTNASSCYDISTPAKAVKALRTHADYMEKLHREMDEINLGILHAEINGRGDFAIISPGMSLGYARDYLPKLDQEFNDAIYVLLGLQKCVRILHDASSQDADAYNKMLGRPGISGHERLRLLAGLIEFRCL